MSLALFHRYEKYFNLVEEKLNIEDLKIQLHLSYEEKLFRIRNINKELEELRAEVYRLRK